MFVSKSALLIIEADLNDNQNKKLILGELNNREGLKIMINMME